MEWVRYSGQCGAAQRLSPISTDKTPISDPKSFSSSPAAQLFPSKNPVTMAADLFFIPKPLKRMSFPRSLPGQPLRSSLVHRYSLIVSEWFPVGASIRSSPRKYAPGSCQSIFAAECSKLGQQFFENLKSHGSRTVVRGFRRWLRFFLRSHWPSGWLRFFTWD